MRPEPEAQDPHDFELLSRELELSSLVQEVTRVMLAGTSLSQVLRSFFLGITELTGVQNMALFNLDEDGMELHPSHSLGIPHEVLDRLRPTRADTPIQGCLASHRHILVERLTAEDPFRVSGAESYLVMPVTARVIDKGHAPEGGPEVGHDGHGRLRPLALLWLDTTPPCPELTGQAISHLDTLARQAGLMMENFLVQRKLAAAHADLQQSNLKLGEAYIALSEVQRLLEADLDQARGIQNSLLPAAFPMHLLRAVASRYIPAGKVGGDYYDCFEPAPGKLGIVVADVSGHGMAAALIMTMFKTLVRTFSAQEPSPAAVLNRINRTFLEQLAGTHFVTAFYAVFDKTTRAFTYCSAGHLTQYLQQDPAGAQAAGRILELNSQGLVLGVFADTFLSEGVIELAPEARLVLFTDGIPEAHGPEGKMFGTRPLTTLIGELGAASPAALVEAVLGSLGGFLGSPATLANHGTLADDVTLFILDL